MLTQLGQLHEVPPLGKVDHASLAPHSGLYGRLPSLSSILKLLKNFNISDKMGQSVSETRQRMHNALSAKCMFSTFWPNMQVPPLNT